MHNHFCRSRSHVCQLFQRVYASRFFLVGTFVRLVQIILSLWIIFHRHLPHTRRLHGLHTIPLKCVFFFCASLIPYIRNGHTWMGVFSMHFCAPVLSTMVTNDCLTWDMQEFFGSLSYCQFGEWRDFLLICDCIMYERKFIQMLIMSHVKNDQLWFLLNTSIIIFMNQFCPCKEIWTVSYNSSITWMNMRTFYDAKENFKDIFNNILWY